MPTLFIRQLGHKCKRMIADRYFKLIREVVVDYLQLDQLDMHISNITQVKGTPKWCQNQNRLAEIRWKNIMSLRRN